VGLVFRWRGLTAGLGYYFNLEKANEVDDDFFRRRWSMSSRALAIALLLAGCADLERGPRPLEPDAGPDAAPSEAGAGDAGSSFAAVYPLIDSGCKHCHMTGGMAADSKFLLSGQAATDYPACGRWSIQRRAAGSRLLAKAAGQGHGGGVIYRTSSTEYAALLAWIQAGRRHEEERHERESGWRPWPRWRWAARSWRRRSSPWSPRPGRTRWRWARP
jgi:hypothetical protein